MADRNDGSIAPRRSLSGPILPPPPPEMKCPALLRARALSPFVATRRPALVRRPIFIISRLLNCAAIISRRFFWAS